MGIITTLERRRLLYQKTPGIEELLTQPTRLYIGIDPTADSLHVGNLATLMALFHFSEAGHQPIVVLGGATALIGDPSGKQQERPLLPMEIIQHNKEKLKKQIQKLIPNALILDNYEWFKNFSLIQFLRDVAKHITVNYLLAKETIEQRLQTGISVTEFCYPLLQAYDFYYLAKHYQCYLQIGGADQWGNITTGIFYAKKHLEKPLHGLTVPLLLKKDGTKYGKTEQGTLWLSAEKTPPYQFYQYWLNVADDEVEPLLWRLTLLKEETIEEILQTHRQQPEKRIAQRHLAQWLTRFVHGEKALQQAEKATEILFGKNPVEHLQSCDEETLLSVFKGVPIYKVSQWQQPLAELLVQAKAFPSKGEVKRLVKNQGLAMNQQKVKDPFYVLSEKDLIANKYVLFRKGKKHYFLLHLDN